MMEIVAFSRKQFLYYKALGERTFAQLSDEDLFWQPHPEANSIAIIVGHLSGNMLSRWTNFLTEDGEKGWRDRDREFEDRLTDRTEILSAWEEGWTALFTALDCIDPDNVQSQVFIRQQAHSIPEAINRQLAHYAYHIGQIVYIGVLRRGRSWASLSIPRNASGDYNLRKMGQGKHGGHFTDGL